VVRGVDLCKASTSPPNPFSANWGSQQSSTAPRMMKGQYRARLGYHHFNVPFGKNRVAKN